MRFNSIFKEKQELDITLWYCRKEKWSESTFQRLQIISGLWFGELEVLKLLPQYRFQLSVVVGESANDLAAQSVSQARVTITHGDACRLSTVTDGFPQLRDILRELGVHFSCYFKQFLISRPPSENIIFKSLSIKMEKSRPVVK